MRLAPCLIGVTEEIKLGAGNPLSYCPGHLLSGIELAKFTCSLRRKSNILKCLTKLEWFKIHLDQSQNVPQEEHPFLLLQANLLGRGRLDADWQVH